MYNKGTVTRLKNYLIEDGATLETEAQSGSIYLKAADLKIRVSDHLPKITSADLIIMYTINMDTYIVSLHGSLICFKSLSDLRQFTKPLLLSALLMKGRPDYVSIEDRLNKIQETSSKIIDEKNAQIESIQHKWNTSQGELSSMKRKVEEKDHEIEKLKKAFDVERQTYIDGNKLKDGYGSTYSLGSFSAQQIRTIQGFIDTNKHMGKLGFIENNDGSGK